jgi:hypothetical protein
MSIRTFARCSIVVICLALAVVVGTTGCTGPAETGGSPSAPAEGDSNTTSN